MSFHPRGIGACGEQRDLALSGARELTSTAPRCVLGGSELRQQYCISSFVVASGRGILLTLDGGLYPPPLMDSRFAVRKVLMPLFKKTVRAEDPARLQAFLDVVCAAPWQGAPECALKKTFVALNALIYHEVLFYYAARKRHRVLSTVTRGLAILLGTAGIFAPLLAGADPERFKHWSAYGYPLLAGAAAMLLVNRLFGATGGHIRYVTAQLQLEQLMTLLGLDWAAWTITRNNAPLDAESKARAMALLRRFAMNAHKIIQDETSVWGKSVSDALDEYARHVSAQQPSESGKPLSAKDVAIRESPLPK